MKRKIVAAFIAALALTFSACGGETEAAPEAGAVTEEAAQESAAEYDAGSAEPGIAEETSDDAGIQDRESETTSIKWEYMDLKDGTISLYNYETDNIPEVMVVPSEVDGKTVTEIDSLFRNEENVKKVILPPTLTHIGIEAFMGSVSIEEVEINGAVEAVYGHAFYNCSGIRSLTFPDGLKKIDQTGIYRNKGLKELHVPASLEMSVDEMGYSVYLTDDTTIFAPAGSVWEQYAKEYNVPFVAE